MHKLLAVAVAVLLGACATTNGNAGENAFISKTSPYGVSETMDRLQAAVSKRGAHVFARVDHAAGAQRARLGLAPEQVLIFGNPKLGTPLMQQNALIGLDLPLKVLVWQDGSTARITYTAPAALAARYGLDPAHPVLVKMGKVLDAITNEAIGTAP